MVIPTNAITLEEADTSEEAIAAEAAEIPMAIAETTQLPTVCLKGKWKMIVF